MHLIPINSDASTFPLDQEDKPISPTEYPYGLEEFKFIFRLGLGASVLPSFIGSNNFEYLPALVGSVDYVKLPYLSRLLKLPDGRRRKLSDGFYVRPSPALSPPRTASDYPELDGLKNVPLAFEFGFETWFKLGNFKGYSKLRRGFRGHHGYRGSVGGQFSIEPTYRTGIELDTRISFADSEFINSNFGITEEEADSSPIYQHSYRADSGLTNAEISFDSYYDISDRRRFHLSAGYMQLLDEVRSSPIVQNGNANHFNMRMGISYRFVFDLTHGN